MCGALGVFLFFCVIFSSSLSVRVGFFITPGETFSKLLLHGLFSLSVLHGGVKLSNVSFFVLFSPKDRFTFLC